MIERPTSIRIGALTYTIEWWDRKDEKITERFAEIDYVDSVIRVSYYRPADRVVASLIHEVMHALAYHYRVTVPDGGDLAFNSEDLADYGGYGLLMVWRDNPEVFDWYVRMVNQSINTERRPIDGMVQKEAGHNMG
jgi:hypothetical protein